ncbi:MULTISPECIES: galactose mutarotase [Prochlorococcus]|uniref:aldose epimerase family protein n=1 Tax=Prochlorococcus TaxID=1218 RepID=UPI002FBD3FA0
MTRKDSPYPHWQFVNIDSGDYLRIVPERGGLITAWNCNGREVLYFDAERFQNKLASVRGGIPVLFPICGDLPGNYLCLPQGQFKINQHGFARDMPWKIKSLEDEYGILLCLSDSDKSKESFPFSFLIEMKILLIDNSLEIRISITNRGNETMPFSFGLHPYFLVKDLDHVLINGLPQKCINHIDKSEVVTKTQLQKLSKGVDFLSISNEPITLIDSLEGSTLELHHQSPMNLTVIWTDPPRQMICLEPWTSPRESLASGDRMLFLEPGASKELSCRFLSN